MDSMRLGGFNSDGFPAKIPGHAQNIRLTEVQDTVSFEETHDKTAAGLGRAKRSASTREVAIEA